MDSAFPDEGESACGSTIFPLGGDYPIRYRFDGRYLYLRSPEHLFRPTMPARRWDSRFDAQKQVQEGCGEAKFGLRSKFR
jgi:hypothetical protein